jgi:GNAT superfamily N-acetyltransferase
MNIRPPTPADYDRVADLAGQLGYPCTGAQIRARLAEMEDPNRYAVLVAELPEGRIAGWIGVHLFRAIELDCRAEITGLIVDQEIRSRGIGQALLAAAEDWARNQGCGAIAVHSNVMRDGAHRFYERRGFQHVKTQKSFCKTL